MGETSTFLASGSKGGAGASPADGRSRLAALGLVLVPVAVVLVVLEVVGAGASLHHYLNLSGTTAKRAEVYWIWFLVIGACGPATVALIWFDPVRTGMSARSRLATIGFVGTAIGLLAALLVIPY
jgi:hypothetical protein